MKAIATLLAMTGVIICTGCVRSVTTLPCNLKGPNSGVVYSLPKTRLKLTIPFTIERRTAMVNGLLSDPTDTPFIVKPIAVEPVLAPDANNNVVLSGEGLIKDVRLESTFKFTVNTNQLLVGVTTDVTDKSPEILQGLVSSGISIAKMVAAAGEGQNSPLKEVAGRLETINSEIAKLALGDNPKKLEEIQKLMIEQRGLLDFAAKYRELNTVKVEEREVFVTKVLDWTDFTWTTNGGNGFGEVAITIPGERLGTISSVPGPPITVQIHATPEQQVNALNRIAPRAKGDNGVFYRVPTQLRTTVTASVKGQDVVFFDDYIPFAQVGAFNKVEARYKSFGKRKTTISFSPTTGSLSEYGVEATSSGEAAAKALDTSLGKVQTAVSDLQRAQVAVEAAKKTPEQIKVAELTQQKSLIEAETALLRAQQELDKLKSASSQK